MKLLSLVGSAFGFFIANGFRRFLGSEGTIMMNRKSKAVFKTKRNGIMKGKSVLAENRDRDMAQNVFKLIRRLILSSFVFISLVGLCYHILGILDLHHDIKNIWAFLVFLLLRLCWEFFKWRLYFRVPETVWLISTFIILALM